MAVVRLKRRYNEEPLNAVLLTSKKRKTEKEDVKTEIFHFATTLKNQDDDVSTHISKVLNSTESKCLYKQHNYTNITEKLRADNKLLSQNNRFKVVTWFRSISDSDFNDDENISYEQGKGVTVVDIESDDLSTPMKEEEDGKISNEYVYDIYYAPCQYLEDILVDNDFSCHPLYTDVFGGCQEAGMEEVPDDEDDSNDENNWRNDYPDEDDLPESSVSGGHMDLAARMIDFNIGDGDDKEDGHRDLSTDEGEEDLIYGLDSDDVERYGLGYASYKKRVCKDFDDDNESYTSCSNESCYSEHSEDEDLD